MQLTDEQKQKVGEWVQSGAALAEIQRKLNDEFGLTLTYMDVRFLVIDLGLEVKDRVTRAPKPPAPPVAAAEDDAFAAGPEPALDGNLAGAGAVAVELDRVTKPGSVVSGTVVFSDGIKAAWSLDQFGRLALSASKPGYQPSAPDVQAFQLELRRALEQRGF